MNPLQTISLCSLSILLFSLATAPVHAASAAKSIQTIRAVGSEGKGNAEASAAWQELTKNDSKVLVDILKGMDNANPIALNWLRSAVDTIAAREVAAGRKLPVSALEDFVEKKSHQPRARRLAYELLAQADPARAEKLLAKMLDDPSTELRRDAVERTMADAKRLRDAKQNEQAVLRYAAALKSARDVDQIETIAKAMKELGQPVRLSEVFGWLDSWQVIGPFDNTKNAGFDQAYPPESKIDLQAEYDGKSGKVRWQPMTTTNEYGLVDLNKPLGTLKGVTGYAYTEIQSSRARSVELRLGCKNGWKIWFNGAYVFGRDEYHRGIEIDQYRFKVDLKPGKNTLLVKVCQNEQTEDWTKEWEFQLRITDDLGAPVDLARR
jgi:hypothetical protein